MATDRIEVTSGAHILIIERCPRGMDCHPMLLRKDGQPVQDANPRTKQKALRALSEWGLDSAAIVVFSAAIAKAPHFNPAAQAA